MSHRKRALGAIAALVASVTIGLTPVQAAPSIHDYHSPQSGALVAPDMWPVDSPQGIAPTAPDWWPFR